MHRELQRNRDGTWKKHENEEKKSTTTCSRMSMHLSVLNQFNSSNCSASTSAQIELSVFFYSFVPVLHISIHRRVSFPYRINSVSETRRPTIFILHTHRINFLQYRHFIFFNNLRFYNNNRLNTQHYIQRSECDPVNFPQSLFDSAV